MTRWKYNFFRFSNDFFHSKDKTFHYSTITSLVRRRFSTLRSVRLRIDGSKPSHLIFVLLFLIFLTEIVTPNLKPPLPFRLSKVERIMGEIQGSMLESFDVLLDDYVRWHHDVSNSAEKMNSVRILAWNGIGDSGLGDKIRGILHALMLAIETGRYFVIEDAPEFPIRKLVTAGRIKWDTRIDLKGEPMFNWRTSFSRGRQGVRRLTEPYFELRHKTHRVVRLASSTYPMYERTVGTAHWRFACRRLRPSTVRDNRCGYLGEQNIYFNRKLYSLLFQLRKSTTVRVNDVLSILPEPEVPFIAVHARLGGKFRREAKTKRFAELNEDWSKTARRLLKCAEIKSGPIYLATDDERFKSIFQKEAEQVGRQIFSSPILPRHSGTVSLEEIPEALKNTFAEGLAMGKSHTLITTGSGLATFAAFTGTSNLTLVDECSTTSLF